MPYMPVGIVVFKKSEVDFTYEPVHSASLNVDKQTNMNVFLTQGEYRILPITSGI